MSNNSLLRPNLYQTQKYVYNHYPGLWWVCGGGGVGGGHGQKALQGAIDLATPLSATQLNRDPW